jgi:hypothetical protein
MTDPDEPGQDVAPRRAEPKVPVQLGVRVTDLDTAYRAAQAIAISGLCPQDLHGKPADVLLVIMYGSELGLSIVQSLQGIVPIKGRITMSAELRVGLTKREGFLTGIACGKVVAKDGPTIIRCGEFAHAPAHQPGPHRVPDHPYQEDHDLERCRYRVENARTGEITFGEFTTEDAVRAGLLTRGKGDNEGKLISRSMRGNAQPWELYGRDMLWNRAAARACRRAAPQVGYGLYTEEEVESLEPVTAEATVEQAPVRVADDAPDVTADELRDLQTSHLEED